MKEIDQQIQQIPIEKIKRDILQPRTIFTEKDIQGLAESIKQEGLINPIEIDPDFVLIVGERRFRAAKLAGLTTIPAKVFSIYPRERFMRQLQENLHTGAGSSMVPLDISNAFEKILSDMEGAREDNILWLSKKIGKSKDFVETMVALQKEKGIFKTYLETPTAKYSLFREADAAPTTKLQEKLKEKVVKGQVEHRAIVRELIRAIKRHPDREQQLLSRDYTGTEVENIIRINQIAPGRENLDNVAKGIDVANRFQGLLLAIKELELDKISKYDMGQIKKLIEILIPQANQIHAQIYNIQQRQLQSGEKSDIVKTETR